jgi:hypothetical protein
MSKSIVGALLFILTVSCRAQTASHELLNGEYLGGRGLSRLSFMCDERFCFHDKNLNANQLRCDLSNISLAKYPTPTPLIIKSGRAKKMRFDLSRHDAVTDIFTLSNNVQGSGRWQRTKPENVVDKSGTDAPDSGGTPVDIASLVRHELDSIQTTGVTAGKQAGPFGSFDFQAMPFGVAVVLSLIGTIALMLLGTKRGAVEQKNSPSIPLATQKQVEVQDNADAILGQAKVILREKTAKQRFMRQQSESEHIETELGSELSNDAESRMVDQMQRASLELELEKRLRARQNGRRDHIALAKKLGIGRGELELAASLRKMNEKQ